MLFRSYNNYIDLCEWTYSCINSLLNSDIVTFIKFHPNTFIPQEENKIYYPVDKRFYDNFLKKYGITYQIKRTFVEKSKIFKNLYCLNPNIDTLSLMNYLKSNLLQYFEDFYLFHLFLFYFH